MSRYYLGIVRSVLRIAAIVAVALGLYGCGGSGSRRPDLLVSAASSLKAPFTAFGEGFEPARARFSFAGSDQLAAQIRAGVRPHVFAAANATLPEALYGQGLVEKPVAFARNRLVVAVPAAGGRGDTRAAHGRPDLCFTPRRNRCYIFGTSQFFAIAKCTLHE